MIRLLDKTGNSFVLEEMGYRGHSLEVVKRGITKPNGMILTSGPTGSGKSTSLYALVQVIKHDAINIVTLEDPVEYKIDGVNQIQVNTAVGLTFANGLRSVLRQDPDVVMVGEIRRQRDGPVGRSGGTYWALGVLHVAYQFCGWCVASAPGYGCRAVPDSLYCAYRYWAAIGKAYFRDQAVV